VISDYLRNSGFVALTARSGESGIEKAHYARPDIIFLDVQMPGINGFETCRLLKSDPVTANIPVIFMTGLSGTEDKVKGFEAGAVDYVTKPFQSREVISRVRMQLKLAALTREFRHTNAELTKHRGRLEELVEERTAEIKSANIQLSDEIIERKRMEKELRKHREQLEDLVRERTDELEAAQEELVRHEKLSVLGQLTATVSHELRNPLGVIQSSAYYLENKLNNVDEKITKHLKRIEEQVGLCDSIIGDLMEYTRGRRSEMIDGELNPFLEEVLAGINPPKPVHILREISPDLPMVRFDDEKLQRVVINLVTNAIQAVVVRQERWKEAEGPYQPQVKLAASVVENRVSIEVEDNGVGMDEETAARAFEPLFTTRARGSGLGLAIVQKIVEEHEGTISIDSESGRGTIVTVVIPGPNQQGSQP